MLRIAIVDDETAEIQKLQELVEQFFREKQVAYQITSYISGETFLVAQQQCDLIFLDVQMTGIDGIATARNIRQNDRKAALIYVSNFSEKMADSFAVHPFAFLEKPVCQNDALTLKGEHGSLIVRVQDILYLEYAGNRKVQIHLKQDEKTVYGSITKFLQLLEPFHFISPHKSYIINPRQIQSVCQLDIILTNQDRIPIAQKRQKQIVAQISDYLHQHLKENLR